MSYIGRHRKPSTTARLQRRLALGTLAIGTAATSGLVSPTAHAQDFAAMSSGGNIINEVAAATGVAQLAPTPSVVRPATGAFTSGYGPRWGTFHYGIDIANAIGTPIYAVMAGTVIDSGPASGYGQWIRIRHDDGSMSVYGHMETLHVGVGQRVDAGHHIAGMGNRGFSTGSHLHFEIHPAGSGPVDPVPWFAHHGIHF
ncbi:MAG: M23 family metallopeptidase [Corynebacterium sp.]|uniref:M23 family metallopeptidase n=1 Tax=Corynebacterium sp. TaxID=1720 RepID=UPI0026E10369|nr:M23 family metallopeptidase [Corynebacterium sp.]MDO5669931.1 M23 family metallopeptidase [Corynebacterium sp.]